VKQPKSAILILILPLLISNCSNFKLFKGRGDQSSSPGPSHILIGSMVVDHLAHKPAIHQNHKQLLALAILLTLWLTYRYQRRLFSRKKSSGWTTKTWPCSASQGTPWPISGNASRPEPQTRPCRHPATPGRAGPLYYRVDHYRSLSII
jgi:hypothetical protein